MPAHPKNKYLQLLDDIDIKRWYDNVSRGSQVTADVYLRRLGAYCKDKKNSPKQLASLNELELYNLLLDLISSMEKEGNAGSYIEGVVKAIRSWLCHNGKEISRKIKIKGTRDSPSLIEERVPTKIELKRIFLSGDKKARCESALVSHCGVRIKTLGNYEGNDGLRVADLPEMRIEDNKVLFDKKPTIVIVRKPLSKAGHQYFTFLSEEGCEYLQDYLEERLRAGEKLTPKSAIITPKSGKKAFIRANNIGDNIREALRAAGIDWRPYVLRCYFDTQLMMAESKGLVLRDYRQFWMGHTGDMENRYTTNKLKLPETVIEDMRQAYARSQEFLETKEKAQVNEDKLKETFRKQLLLVAGLSNDEVDKMDLTATTDEELQSIVRKKLLGESANKRSDQTIPPRKQKVIKVEEASAYLNKGWQFVSKLTDSMLIVSNDFDIRDPPF